MSQHPLSSLKSIAKKNKITKIVSMKKIQVNVNESLTLKSTLLQDMRTGIYYVEIHIRKQK